MKTEVTLQLVRTITAKDEDDHQAKLEKIVADLEGDGYSVMVEDEDRLDDVYDVLGEEDDFIYGEDDGVDDVW
jgi:hypothetical protein